MKNKKELVEMLSDLPDNATIQFFLVPHNEERRNNTENDIPLKDIQIRYKDDLYIDFGMVMSEHHVVDPNTNHTFNCIDTIGNPVNVLDEIAYLASTARSDAEEASEGFDYKQRTAHKYGYVLGRMMHILETIKKSKR